MSSGQAESAEIVGGESSSIQAPVLLLRVLRDGQARDRREEHDAQSVWEDLPSLLAMCATERAAAGRAHGRGDVRALLQSRAHRELLLVLGEPGGERVGGAVLGAPECASDNGRSPRLPYSLLYHSFFRRQRLSRTTRERVQEALEPPPVPQVSRLLPLLPPLEYALSLPHCIWSRRLDHSAEELGPELRRLSRDRLGGLRGASCSLLRSSRPPDLRMRLQVLPVCSRIPRPLPRLPQHCCLTEQ